jgi:hypothetical protein
LYRLVLTDYRRLAQAGLVKRRRALLARRLLWAMPVKPFQRAFPTRRWQRVFPPLRLHQRWAAERAVDIRAGRRVPSEGNPGAEPHHLAGWSKSTQRGEPIESKIPGP